MSAEDRVDVAVIGGGPAGLSAALNLVRARRSVLLVDGNRPRNAATLHSHGFLTRDGLSPLELRRLGREEFERYPGASVASAQVDVLRGEHDGFLLQGRGVRGGASVDVRAGAIVLATGLRESLPAFPSIRAWYGTDLHSCMECDGWEKADRRLALIGESADLADRALLLRQWSSDVVVFTCGSTAVTDREERSLAERGIRVERRAVTDVVGEAGHMTGVLLEDGSVLERDAGFVRPTWQPMLEFASELGLAVDAEGLLVVDAHGRTSVPGVYAAGDITPPGPEQLIVAAGEGARVAATLNRDLVGALHLPDASV
ncbi:NAD(P)/FAD-dependent oxidoreductase [Rathayibacter sp. YIM 133350]|uniref:NAD(P)/FAD-dependent oxidoreductase n=1 Tax=Rathayibacter sp. YIM 133350 TaxID=3131992 RepID=UPI00307FC668